MRARRRFVRGRVCSLFLTSLSPCITGRIKKTVTVRDAKAARAEKAPASALDSALSEIQGPKAMSTMTKSSLDWDNFKEKQGLEEELETAGQDGCVSPQESYRDSVFVITRDGAVTLVLPRGMPGISRRRTSYIGAMNVSFQLSAAPVKRSETATAASLPHNSSRCRGTAKRRAVRVLVMNMCI